MSSIPQLLGERVYTLRYARDLTQQQLADKLGRDQSSISKIEAGKQELSAQDIYAVAAALDVGVPELLDFADDDMKACLANIKQTIASNSKPTIQESLASIGNKLDEILVSINSIRTVGRKSSLGGYGLVAIPDQRHRDVLTEPQQGPPATTTKLDPSAIRVHSTTDFIEPLSQMLVGDEQRAVVAIEDFSHNDPPMVSAEAVTSASDAIIGGAPDSHDQTSSLPGQAAGAVNIQECPPVGGAGVVAAPVTPTGGNTTDLTRPESPLAGQTGGQPWTDMQNILNNAWGHLQDVIQDVNDEAILYNLNLLEEQLVRLWDMLPASEGAPGG